MKINRTLPIPAEAFIPHRMPMRLVDTLIYYKDAGGLVETTIADDCILVNTDGSLDEAAFVELLAQGYAVVKGYDDTEQGKQISEGYLVGARKLRITGRAYAGDKLQVRIRTVGCFEGFAVAEGEIVRAEQIIASGSIKLWIVGMGDAL
jgi:predicted hotdog family 3-hydroxylacyl-ACP dehydratase